MKNNLQDQMAFHKSFLGKLRGKRSSQNEHQGQDQDDLYPEFPPPPPRELIDHRNDHLQKHRERRFAAPKGETEDKPLYVLYRLYEYIILDNITGMRNEIELFWWTKFPISDIPDPQDTEEPERYAVLSCIPSLLVEAYNQRIEMGLRREAHSFMSQEERDAWAATPKVLERIPLWAAEVRPLENKLLIPHCIWGETQVESSDDTRASPAFKEKNILIWHPHIHFM